MTLSQRRSHLLLWLALVPCLVAALLVIRIVQVASQRAVVRPAGPTAEVVAADPIVRALSAAPAPPSALSATSSTTPSPVTLLPPGGAHP